MTAHQKLAAPVVQVTLLTKTECALCEHAKTVLAAVGTDHALEVVEVDLDSKVGSALAVDNGVLFAPGVILDGKPFSYGRLSERKLRRTLEQLRKESG
jgi:hypothetical protein